MIGDIPDYIMRHVFNASTLIFFATDSPHDQMLIEKNLSRRFKAEDIGQLKKGEAFVKMLGSAFNMSTERVPEPSSKGWTDEIIALSRARYTAVKVATQAKNKKESSSPKEYGWSTPKMNPYDPSPGLSHQEKAFLKYVFHNPVLSVTGIYRKQGLSAYMGDKIKKALKDKGLLCQVSTHLGSGSRIAKFLLLTSEGFSALGTEFSSTSGKGGLAHRYWQSIIGFHAKGLGYSSLIEESISGSKETVDIGLMRYGKRTAIEISVASKKEQEANNIAKCLKAGYDQVLTLFLEENKKVELEKLVRNIFSEQEQSRLTIGLVYDFYRLLQ